MVCNLLNVLFHSVCSYFVEDCCIYVHQGYWPVIFFYAVLFISFYTFAIPSDCDSPRLECGFPLASLCLCFSFLPQQCPFIHCCGGSVHSLLRGNYSICSCRFVVPMGGSEFRILRHCHHFPHVSSCDPMATVVWTSVLWHLPCWLKNKFIQEIKEESWEL